MAPPGTAVTSYAPAPHRRPPVAVAPAVDRRPVAPRRPPGPARRPATPAPAQRDAELVAAVVLLLAVGALGAYLRVRPGPILLDRLASGVAPARHHGSALVALTRLGSPPVVLAGMVAGALATIRRHPARAMAVLAGPPLAIGIGQWVLKPLVGRTLDGVLTFPSGTVTAVAALATVAVVATPDAWRGVAGVVGGVATVMTAAAAVALGWHYASDAAGGAALGAGTILLLDSLARRLVERGAARGAAGAEAWRPANR